MANVRKLDLNLVVVLDALLAERNLTRAGERVGLTQPAVSGALNRLREMFDDPLLEREGRGFVLTPRAESLRPIVRESMMEVRRTFDVLPDFDPATSKRTFLVAASDYVLSEITSPLLQLLKREAPGTRVEFAALPGDSTVTPEDLLQYDVTIVGTGRGIPGKRASLFSDRFVCIVDQHHPELVNGTLSMEALSRIRFVQSTFGSTATTHIDDMFATSEFEGRNVVSVRGFLTVPFVVAGTQWAGWVPERTAQRFSDLLGLVIADTPISPRVLVEAAHWHPSKSGDAALQWLLGQLRVAAESVEFGDDALD